MKLLEYLNSKLKPEDITNLRTIIRRSDGSLPNSSKDIILLIKINKLRNDLLRDRFTVLEEKREYNGEESFSNSEANILAEQKICVEQDVFLNKVKKHVENWEFIFSHDINEDTPPERTNGNDELQEVNKILAQLHKDILEKNQEKLGPKNYKKEIAKAAVRSLIGINEIENSLLKKENLSAAEKKFFLNWSREKNTSPNIYRRLFHFIKGDFNFPWELSEFVRTMGKYSPIK